MMPPDPADYPPGTSIDGIEVRLARGLWLLDIDDWRGNPLYRGLVSSSHENGAIPFRRVAGGIHISGCGIVIAEVVIAWYEVAADFKKNAAPMRYGSS